VIIQGLPGCGAFAHAVLSRAASGGCDGEVSQPPMCPHCAHRRRCSHQPPFASHSTQPVPLGGTDGSIPGTMVIRARECRVSGCSAGAAPALLLLRSGDISVTNDLQKRTGQGHHGPDLQFLVELRGFEPLAPSMRTRCATGLRYSPKNGCQRSKLSRLLARLRCPSQVTARCLSRRRRAPRRRRTGRTAGHRGGPRCR
jgi:hypothetical protein